MQFSCNLIHVPAWRNLPMWITLNKFAHARAFDYPSCKRSRPRQMQAPVWIASLKAKFIRYFELTLLSNPLMITVSRDCMVEPGGIEPPTSCVQGRRSPSWAMAPFNLSIFLHAALLLVIRSVTYSMYAPSLIPSRALSEENCPALKRFKCTG